MNDKRLSWADMKLCEHGRTLNQECDYCELEGLKESLTRMKRKVIKDENRLAELEEKLNPLNN